MVVDAMFVESESSKNTLFFNVVIGLHYQNIPRQTTVIAQLCECLLRLKFKIVNYFSFSSNSYCQVDIFSVCYNKLSIKTKLNKNSLKFITNSNFYLDKKDYTESRALKEK